MILRLIHSMLTNPRRILELTQAAGQEESPRKTQARLTHQMTGNGVPKKGNMEYSVKAQVDVPSTQKNRQATRK